MLKFDLIGSSKVKKIVKSAFFPYALQIIAFAFFLLLITVGLRTGSTTAFSEEMQDVIVNTNFTTLLVWGLWWPSMVIVAMLFGRVWCTVCPMELLSHLANRLAKLTGMKQMTLPRWVAAGGAALILYVSLQFIVPVFEVDKLPLATAIMLIVLVSVALATGILFKEGRAFCKGFCPASLLLRAYNFISPFGTSHKSDDVCASCKTRDCVVHANRDRLDDRSCPSYLKPYALTKHEDCVNCFQCAKVCPKGNIGFGFLSGWRAEQTRQSLKLPLSIFIFVEAGYLSHELFAESSYTGHLFHLLPERIAAFLGNQALLPYLEAGWFLVLIPGAVALTVWTLKIVGRQKSSIAEYFSKIALALLPVLVTGHAAKAIIKLNEVAGFLPYALQNPRGVETAQQIAANTIAGAGPLLSPLYTTLSLTLAVTAAIIFSIARTQRKMKGAMACGAYAAILLYGGLYAFVIFDLFLGVLKGA